MGILNTTPDSFFDGGKHFSVDDAVSHGLKLASDGADVIDVGGESTRPDSVIIDVKTEIDRTIPVIRKLRASCDALISIDTRKSEVAKAAIEAGANIVNDVSGGRFDPDMKAIVATLGCNVVIQHSRGTPQDMQIDPHYCDGMSEVRSELASAVSDFVAAGVLQERIILDPGIGFAKRFEDNIDILNRLPELLADGFPVLLGTSRKAFVGTITGRNAENRLAGSLASVVAAYFSGVRFFRVHDVAETRDALLVAEAIKRGKP